ncbi:uncharacterized protein F4822DRAFT_384606 [Hypoxylon trugodes]|uniref:uncharacterized protein n=1 Tax=Hypoxylon trugodes TaxID=326681 RepID=UPI00219796A8|nr:uncharacterized protein F4822DRAFT_384606 [Hypoxylon trugodes]KAI1393429.1 hypothetical protein F4822DRAFT_384606 [Hypoxylon trugodes]
MASFIVKKILKETAGNQFGAGDPYFEQVPATRLDGKPSKKTKKVRKALPPGISEHDAMILTKVKRRAYRLDMNFGSFMGLKIGWGSVIGLFPFAGDAVDALLAMMVVRTAKQVEGGLPFHIWAWMYVVVLIDFVAGLVPFVGDIADAMILANTRNAVTLEEYLRKKGQKNLRNSHLPVPEVDPSDPIEFDRFNSESPEHASSRATRRGDTTGRSRTDYAPQESGVGPERPVPSTPAAARVRDDRQGGSGRGFFGFGGSRRSRPTDVEMGGRN